MFYSEIPLEIDDNIRKNFLMIDAECRESLLLKLSELASLAFAMAQYVNTLLSYDTSLSDALSDLREGVKDDEMLYSRIEEYDAVSEPAFHMMENMHTNERAILVLLLLEELKKQGIYLREDEFVGTGDDKAVFAYVKNPLADEAYDLFAENIPDACVRYVSSFSEGVRLLRDGEVGYCLFPIEERGALRLPTVENLLYSADLKIRRIVPVFGFDGSAELKYALVSSSVYIEPYQKEDDRYLEVRVRTEEGTALLSSLLFAMKLYGLSLYRIHTVSFERDGVVQDYLSLVIRSSGGDFSLLLAYLTLFVNEYTVVGIYKNLEG